MGRAKFNKMAQEARASRGSASGVHYQLPSRSNGCSAGKDNIYRRELPAPPKSHKEPYSTGAADTRSAKDACWYGETNSLEGLPMTPRVDLEMIQYNATRAQALPSSRSDPRASTRRTRTRSTRTVRHRRARYRQLKLSFGRCSAGTEVDVPSRLPFFGGFTGSQANHTKGTEKGQRPRSQKTCS